MKPMRIFHSLITDSYYATKSYRERGDGLFEVTGLKYDVTPDIKALLKAHDKRKPKRARGK